MPEEQDSRCPKCNNIMTGRHCTNCRYSRPAEPKPQRPVTFDPEREKTTQLNLGAMTAIVAESSIPLHDLDKWRATKREPGGIAGLPHLDLVILATDGCRAIYHYASTTTDDSGYMLGHVEHFSGTVESLFAKEKTTAGPRKPRKPSKPRLDKFEQAMELLRQAAEQK